MSYPNRFTTKAFRQQKNDSTYGRINNGGDRTGKAPGADAEGPNGNEPDVPRPRMSAKERRKADRKRTQEQQGGADAYGGRDTGGHMSENNQVQNREYGYLTRKYNLDEKEMEQLHKQLHDMGGHHSKEEVEQLILDIISRRNI